MRRGYSRTVAPRFGVGARDHPNATAGPCDAAFFCRADVSRLWEFNPFAGTAKTSNFHLFRAERPIHCAVAVLQRSVALCVHMHQHIVLLLGFIIHSLGKNEKSAKTLLATGCFLLEKNPEQSSKKR